MAFLAFQNSHFTRKLGLVLCCLVSFATIFSSVEGNYSNTVLYPVSEETRAARAAETPSSDETTKKRQSGAPSRYLEYEGPDATYNIRSGAHPTISYPNLEDFPDTEIRIRYDRNKSSKKGIFQTDDCPRHFLWLSDKAVKHELDYRVKKGRWSERVMVEKTYFTLFYGGTGLASQYMDSVDDFQTDLEGWEIMNRTSNHCVWEGVECIRKQTAESNNAPDFVVGFSINGFSLEGTLPQDLYHLSHLRKLDLNGNQIQGTIPASWGKLQHIAEVDLGFNRLSGTIPSTLEAWTNLRYLEISSNQLEGEISPTLIETWGKRDTNTTNNHNLSYDNKDFEMLDLSENKFQGSFPMDALVNYASNLHFLDLSGNLFTGGLPQNREEENDSKKSCRLDDQPNDSTEDSTQNCTASLSKSQKGLSAMTKLKDVDLSRNAFQGHVSKEWMKLPSLQVMDLSENKLTGSIPEEIWMASSLERLDLSYNKLTGTIPSWDEDETDASWSKLSLLESLFLDHNQISGSIPYDLFHGLGSTLEEINLGRNKLIGSLPSSLSKMQFLVSMDAHGNQLTGKLPHEMNQMSPNLELNLTDNLLVGSVPKLFCGGGAASANLLFRQFGCDAVLCPAGTFHPNGAASLFSGCRPCPVKKGDDPLSARVLGSIRCGDHNNRTTFIHGDLNGDGELSEREVLRLLYTYTGGPNWGTQFENWADTAVDKCDLNGVVCVDGKVGKLDLTDASLCTTTDRKAAKCKGIPSEISKLTQLEILTMNRRNFLRGTLPTEIGELTKLKYLDINSCPLVTGTLPTEIGRLTDLVYLNIGGCRFNGTIPEELFELEKLEKLHLSMNPFTGTMPSSIEKMTNLKELLLSRTFVNGTIPEGVGELGKLENFEMYGNQLAGAIPESLGRCTNLKRIDLFNNKLTGTIPESLADIRALQILHIKLNHLTGTISSGFGKLPNLSWFDVSTNFLHGTIPESFGYSKTLKDFRLGGGNMIHNPVPKSLCTNTNINGGLTKTYGCSGVICPYGTYSDPGHATHSDGCKPCSNGRTTIYLGSSRCVELTEGDILTLFYDVMTASNKSPVQEKHWSFDRDKPICSWNGVKCDENDTIESIWFPLLDLNADVND